jgi:hypothetical protein
MFKKNKKFLIKTPTGYEKFEGVQKKIVNSMYTVEFIDNTHIKCSGNHALLTETGFKFANELQLENTISGKKIKNISFVTGKFEVFDPVGVDKHSSYFSNGVVSHNTEFLGSTNTLISGLKLQKLMYSNPIAEHDMMKIYEQPIKGDDEGKKDHLYCITVDVSEGKNLDSSAFSVIDISVTPYKQVASYKSSSISPILFPTIIYNAGKLYNDAYIIVEINNTPQVADILHTDLEYENLFKVFTGNKKPQQLSAGFARGVQLGVKMSPQVKRIGCSNLKTLIEGDKLVVQDFDTISELTTFVQSKNSFAAEDDANDDMAMTLVIFAWVSTQKYFKEIVNHDIRKQIQLENMNQVEDLAPPAMLVDTGIEHKFEVIDGDVWEEAHNGAPYSNFIRDMIQNL